MNEGKENDVLWCLHIQGPDDMHPAPSRAHAELGAHLLNEWVASRDVKDEGYPGIEGVVAIWPHSPEAHAAEAGEFAERFIYPSSLTCGKVAQQGREVGLPPSYTASVLTTIAGGAPSVTFHFDDVDEAEAWHKRITDAAPKQQAVSEADIYWLREQVRHGPLSHSFIKDEKRCEVCKRLAKIDAALLAALPGKTEVDRG